LSHAYAARRTAELVGRKRAELPIVTCHLGAGASLAAVKGGASVDTTMGFTPNEGLMMATRCGSFDPGATTTRMASPLWSMPGMIPYGSRAGHAVEGRATAAPGCGRSAPS
jgi:acetate kinase